MADSKRHRAGEQGLVVAYVYWWLFWAISSLANSYFGLHPPRWKDYLAGLATAAGWAALTVAFGRRGRIVFCVAGYVVLGLSALLRIGAIATTGSEFSPSYVAVLLQTNGPEAREFLTAAGGVGATAVFAAMLLLPLLPLAELCRLGVLTGRRRQAIAGGLAVLAAPALFARAIGSSSPYADYGPVRVYPALYWGIREAARARYAVPASLTAVTVTAEPPELLVVVVGESTSRRHMGLYGYARPTTPRLSAVAGELYAFTDALSCQVYTNASLEDIFSLPRAGSARPATLFQALRAAGFDVWWLSNESPFGIVGDGLHGFLADVAHRQWLNRLMTPDRSVSLQRAPLDEVVLPALDNALRGPGKRAIFVHLMGSHIAFASRYPKQFAIFSGSPRLLPPEQAKVVGEYDNSVLYNDWVVSAILDRVRAAGGSSAFVFFSDHGEEVYDDSEGYGHFPNRATKTMAEVPFVVWLSSGFKASHPEMARQLPGWVNRPISLADFSVSLADLAGVSFPRWRAERSFFAPQFWPAQRLVGGRPYDQLPGASRR
jgi:heptose-I-phosphate ethanolaminephosphotransferase